MNGFIQHHGEKIIGVLKGFDRMLFRGTVRRISSAKGMSTYLQYIGVLLKDFKEWSKGVTAQMREASEGSERFQGRPNIYLDNPGVSKEEIAREIARRDTIEEGPICILRAVEPCYSFDVRKNAEAKTIELVPRIRKCLHIYHYQIHPELGFMHARLQTWFPFKVQVCINGREVLRRSLDRDGIGYVKRENCFLELENVSKAQELMDKQVVLNWERILTDVHRVLSPAHQKVFAGYPLPYYWSVDESEWATDIMFRSEADLNPLYEELIRYSMSTFGSRDVLRFLGRKVPKQGGVHGSFSGEVTTDLKHRSEGIRIKHRSKKNSIKMYNKQGSVLRVETTINNAREFKQLRRPEGATKEKKPRFLPMRKGIVDLPRRAQVSDASNVRYLEALSPATSSQSLGSVIRPISRSRTWKQKKVRALNPFAENDIALLKAVSQGEFAINGFRNRDLRQLLFPATPRDTNAKRKQSAVVTRRLRMLRAHRLIKKVSGTHLYRLTTRGKNLCGIVLSAESANAQQLLKLAA